MRLENKIQSQEENKRKAQIKDQGPFIFSPMLALALLIAVSVSFSFSGCGFERTKTPESVPVGSVEVNQNVTWGLSAQTDKQVFRGSLLIWKPETSRNDVAEILKATRIANQSYAKRLESIETLLAQDLGSLEAEIKALNAEIAVLAQESQTRDRLAMLEVGKAWYAKESNVLKERFGESFDSVHADALFGRYCDAKLWELAMKPILADGVFSVRPVATPICESYFKTRGYFTEPQCAEEDSEEGSEETLNYFSCIWKNLKKTTFVTEGPLNLEKHAPVLDALSNSEEFKGWLARKGTGATFCGVFTKVRQFPQFNVKTANPCLIPGTEVALELNVVTSNTELSLASAKDVADAIERLEELKSVDSDLIKNSPPNLQFVPAAGALRAGRVLSEVELASDALAAKLRQIGFAKATCGGQTFSLTDITFNLPFALFNLVNPSLDACIGLPSTADFPELFVKDPKLVETQAVLDLKIEMQKELSRNACDMTQESGPGAYRKIYAATKKSQVEIVDARALLARNFELSLQNVSADKETVAVTYSLQLGGYRIDGLGCFQGYLDGRSVACPAEMNLGRANEKTAQSMEVAFDPSDQKISVQIPVSETFLNGLDSTERELFTPLKDTTMAIDFYGNAFDEKINYLSGTAAFKKGEEIVTRGVGSYLIEATDLVVKEAALCSR